MNIFSFESYEINRDSKEIKLNYKLKVLNKDYLFTEKLSFPSDLKWRNVPEEILDSALQAVHLASGVSYWKTYCPKKIEIKNSSLSRSQANFWDKVYTNGLGEFFYKNKIDYRNLVKFPSLSKSSLVTNHQSLTTDRSLLLFGGGKDSLVSAELLKKNKKPFTYFYLCTGEMSPVIKKLLPKSPIVVKRTIDPKLFKLNNMGAYNGHVPITAIVACVAQLSALLYGYKYIISSNERSADYGNVKYLGSEINHQWSKSLEFENMLQKYTKKYISEGVKFFSLLRPFYEIKIIEIFSRLGEKYFNKFTSCNVNFKVVEERISGGDLWCCKCAKCIFLFTCLSAFLPKKKLVSIFGKNLFADEELIPLFKELLGIRKIKPFDCVGTPEEMMYALSQAVMSGEYSGDTVIKMFADKVEVKPGELKKIEKKLFSFGKHLIPEKFIKLL